MSTLVRIFIPLYAAIFMSSVGLGILSPILPAYVDQFAANTLTLGLVFSSYSLARTLFMTPVGYLSDRWGRRPFILLGLAFFTVVSPLYVYSEGIRTLMATRFLQGIAAAMLLPVAMSYIGDVAPRGREGFIMGTFTSAFFAGLGFGPLIGGFLKDRFSISAAFYGMGLLSLLALAVTALTLPPSIPSSGDRGRKTVKMPAALLDGELTSLLFFRFSRALGIGVVWVLMPLYAMLQMGLSSLQVGVLLSVNTFVTTFLQSPLGHLSDRFGHLRSLFLGTFAASAGIAGIAWARNFTDLVILSVMMGLGGALIVPAGSALAVGIGRRRSEMGGVMGWYNTSLSMGTLLGPVIGGWLTDSFGSRIVFPLAAATGLIGLLVLFLRAWRGGLPHEPSAEGKDEGTEAQRTA